jgi:hypothetical protein
MGGMDAKPGRKKVGRRSIAILVGLLAVYAALYFGDRLVLNPWSMSVTGAPTLLGYWEGDVAFGPADRRRFVMELRYDDPGGNCGGCPRIGGDAVLCGPSGADRYELTGHPKNRSGSRFGVGPRRTSGQPGKVLEQLNGEWAEDRITIRTTLHVVDADGVAHSSTSTDKPVPVVVMELRRSDEAGFERAC